MVLYCLLPQIHSMDKPEELQKKHPVRFFKTATSILYFRTARLSFRRFFSYTCFFLFNMRLFFTDAIISYSIQKSIVWIVNIYTLFPVFLYIFYIFPDYFRLYFNDLIFITDIFLCCLIYFFKLY